MDMRGDYIHLNNAENADLLEATIIRRLYPEDWNDNADFILAAVSVKWAHDPSNPQLLILAADSQASFTHSAAVIVDDLGLPSQSPTNVIGERMQVWAKRLKKRDDRYARRRAAYISKNKDGKHRAMPKRGLSLAGIAREDQEDLVLANSLLEDNCLIYAHKYDPSVWAVITDDEEDSSGDEVYVAELRRNPILFPANPGNDIIHRSHRFSRSWEVFKSFIGDEAHSPTRRRAAAKKAAKKERVDQLRQMNDTWGMF